MKVLVTNAWKCTSEQLDEIRSFGNEVVYMEHERGELPCEASWPEAIVCSGGFLENRIETFSNLRYIQVTSAGLDRVPLDYIKSHGIELRNAHGVYSIPMAEYVISGVLDIYKESFKHMDFQRKHEWSRLRSMRELNGKNVLIVGCGEVGRECAKRFKAFNCRVIGVNRTLRDEQYFDDIYPLANVDKYIPDADIIVSAVGLAEETYHFIGEGRLALMKADAILVNVSRGAVIDMDALAEAAPSIGGAVIDVFEEEPLSPDNPIWNVPNVIITPHNSWAGDGNRERMDRLIMGNLENISNK